MMQPNLHWKRWQPFIMFVVFLTCSSFSCVASPAKHMGTGITMCLNIESLRHQRTKELKVGTPQSSGNEPRFLRHHFCSQNESLCSGLLKCRTHHHRAPRHPETREETEHKHMGSASGT